MFKAIILSIILTTSCGPISDMLSGEEQVAYAELLAEEAKAEALLEEAHAASPADAESVADAETALAVATAKVNEVEDRAIRERWGPIWGSLAMLPVVGPYMQWLGPFAGSLLLPLAGKRGRKHYGSFASRLWAAVKDLLPGVAGAGGSRGVSVASAGANLGAAGLSALRALGIRHSSEASARAAG